MFCNIFYINLKKFKVYFLNVILSGFDDHNFTIYLYWPFSVHKRMNIFRDFLVHINPKIRAVDLYVLFIYFSLSSS